MACWFLWIWLTFYVDEQIEQPLDYVEINAIIKADGDSLE